MEGAGAASWPAQGGDTWGSPSRTRSARGACAIASETWLLQVIASEGFVFILLPIFLVCFVLFCVFFYLAILFFFFLEHGTHTRRKALLQS